MFVCFSDYVVIELSKPANIAGLNIDTAHFNGNHAVGKLNTLLRLNLFYKLLTFLSGGSVDGLVIDQLDKQRKGQRVRQNILQVYSNQHSRIHFVHVLCSGCLSSSPHCYNPMLGTSSSVLNPNWLWHKSDSVTILVRSKDLLTCTSQLNTIVVCLCLLDGGIARLEIYGQEADRKSEIPFQSLWLSVIVT